MKRKQFPARHLFHKNNPAYWIVNNYEKKFNRYLLSHCRAELNKKILFIFWRQLITKSKENLHET